MQNDELTLSEVEEMRSEVSSVQPPAGLENRVIASLAAEGLIRDGARQNGQGQRWLQMAAAAIIATIAFLGGLMVSSRSSSEPQVPPVGMGATYMLLLRESESSAPPSTEDVERLVAEYSAWANEKASEGVLLGGEKLDVGGMVLDPGSPEPHPWSPAEGFVGGYFVIRANGYDEAARVARTCPHLDYGGTIEIRRIDPT